jgi:uncharacterized membrane protein
MANAKTVGKGSKPANKQAHATTSKPSKLHKLLPYIFVIGGVIGLVASGALTLDEIQLLKDPSFVPACSLNPIISCGSVMKSSQAHVFFGIPNPLYGLVAFPVLIAVGMAMFAGAQFKQWFWRLLQLGTLAGVVFVHWLFFQTVYHINALCPWCMGVWLVTITTFWYVLLYNLEHRIIPTPAKWCAPLTKFFRKHHLDVLILWFVILAALIFQHFWYYFGQFI